MVPGFMVFRVLKKICNYILLIYFASGMEVIEWNTG
jgi:hypothetical protein